MLILALETSGLAGSVALTNPHNSGGERQLAFEPASARALAPAIRDVLRLAGVSASDVGLVGVTVGPGSFTGLRIGVATAKTFAYARGIPVAAVNSLEVIALAAWKHEQCALVPADRRLSVVIDAQRGELFAGDFTLGESGPSWSGSTRLVAIDEWLTTLAPFTLVAGPALSALGPRLPAHAAAVDPAAWLPQAASVARLAWREYEAGRCQSAFELVPLYLRASAAEEKLAGGAAGIGPGVPQPSADLGAIRTRRPST
jgi:tRNA threonylcarbamoyladenosine biosynthesis protein TsaB